MSRYQLAETGRTSSSTPNRSNVRPEEKKDPGLLLAEANKLLVHLGVRRTAEVLVSLIGIVGLHVLVLEANR